MNAPLWLTAAIEAALNRYLGLDPAAATRLAPLTGKVLAVEVRGIGLRFYLLPDAHGIRVRGEYAGIPDAELAGAPFSLARLALRPEDRRTLFEGAVTVSGDTELAGQLQDALNQLDIDWEEQLARVTGDVIAHQAGNAARAARRWGEHGADALSRDLADYLHEESRQLPTRAEVETFLNEVDTLRADLDRLAARVQRLVKAST